ncbi:enoyl-CoA hydratase/isomerase family protein [Nocardia cyriacigeorgica]|uniref:enoyl-CoA hydratase/isomerase family protein n=1 Tax=Nocardia cyriacigeorgica TaxID=135487 RepID=UPI002455D041|nr:enoyl-CoA hydratase/isomerase family protein [Nocardia cyriacigeorgica]
MSSAPAKPQYWFFDDERDEPRLLTERVGRVVIARFNNPPHHFFDDQASIELDQLTRWVQRDESVGAVVFTGPETTFTHLDVDELLRGARLTPFAVPYRPARVLVAAANLASRSRVIDRLLRRTRARDLLFLPRTTAAFARMNRTDTVFIAAINGTALAFGCVLALACDIRLMAQGDHRIGLPESAVAMIGGAGGTQRLVRMVGSARAAELLLEGRCLSPDEAAAIGLVHRVVAPEDVLTEAVATAQRLAHRSALVNREIKRAVYDAGSRPLQTGLAMEAAGLVAAVSAPGADKHFLALRDELQRDPVPTGDAIRRAWERLSS